MSLIMKLKTVHLCFKLLVLLLSMLCCPVVAGTVEQDTRHDLTEGEILYKDSTDYHDALIMENGRPSMYQFDGGYCSLWDKTSKAEELAFHYYTKDHLGNNREVVSEDGTVEQVTNYYPFGTPYSDHTAKGVSLQKYKYNGKELDLTHGLNTYDYGARQYYSVLLRWDRLDPLCTDYYHVSPYVYCMNNPVNAIDPDGRDTYLYARQLNQFIPMVLAVHTFVVVYMVGKSPQYFSYGPSGKYRGTLVRTYYDDDMDIYNHADKTLQHEAIKINPPEGMSEMEFDENVIKAANEFYEDSNFRYNMLTPKKSLNTGNCNTSSSTLLYKAGVSKEKLNDIREEIPGNAYGFGDIKPWTKEEKEDIDETYIK